MEKQLNPGVKKYRKKVDIKSKKRSTQHHNLDDYIAQKSAKKIDD